MEVGKVVLWAIGYPNFYEDQATRLFKVLSITLTHVYIQNLYTGYRMNISINTFNREFKVK